MLKSWAFRLRSMGGLQGCKMRAGEVSAHPHLWDTSLLLQKETQEAKGEGMKRRQW